ncbi:MAG: SDR family oxidoreductase [Betaproteobacteria bacterium]|nr:SDR family oxidoreductase [Betaproteobacteria bacterium]
MVQPAPAPSRVLVTGASGFVGSTLCRVLVEAGHAPRAAVHRIVPGSEGHDTVVCVGEIDSNTDWSHALRGVDCVVHLAARAHVMRERAADPLAEYRRINVEGTRRLAEQAVAAGVRRLVFLSSVKVNGEATARPFTENDAPRPEDAYGISKWEAEQALKGVAARSKLEVVILRPPLVYGPGVKGNFLALMRAIARGLPLPLASVDNRRSLIYVENLAGAIELSITKNEAAGRTYLVSDAEDVSMPQLIRALAAALGTKARLWPSPPPLLKAAGRLLGRADAVARLTGSLQVDSSKIRRELSWRPRSTLAQGLAETARWYHAEFRNKMTSPPS